MRKPQPQATPGKSAPIPPSRAAGHPVPDGERRYKAEDAVHTLKRAAEIKADPKLMADVKATAKHHAHNLRKIAR